MARPEVSAAILTKLRALCLALPETREETAWAGVRWMIRTRNFAHAVAIDGGWPPAYARAAGSDGPVTVVTFRASGFLYDTLRTAGPPFFVAEWGTRWGTKVIGLAVDRRTDWDEVGVLITESYRLLAPRKLTEGMEPPRRVL
jgi:hypothetical protein